MITHNGLEIKIPESKITKEAVKWAKDAADRIFSHYSKTDLELMKKRNQ